VALNYCKEGYSSPQQSNGKTFSLWLGGHTTYGACIFIANLVIFHRHYCHQLIGGGIIAMMVSAFFVISLIQSQWPNPTTFADISHIFPTFMATPLIFLTLIIACLGVSAGELFLRFKQDEEE